MWWSAVAIRRRRMIWPIGLTSFGHASTHLKQCVQSKIPCGSWARSLSRSNCSVVARIADEAVGLGQRRRADEARVDLHRQAVRDARPALDAGHRLGDVDHRLVAARGTRARAPAAWRSSHGVTRLDLLPVDRVHVDDQVLEHRHVAHRLDLDHAVRGAAQRGVEVRVAGQRRFAVDADAARAADRLAAGAADPDRAVEAVAACSIASSTERCGSSSTVCSSQYGASTRLGVIAAQASLNSCGGRSWASAIRGLRLAISTSAPRAAIA